MALKLGETFAYDETTGAPPPLPPLWLPPTCARAFAAALAWANSRPCNAIHPCGPWAGPLRDFGRSVARASVFPVDMRGDPEEGVAEAAIVRTKRATTRNGPKRLRTVAPSDDKLLSNSSTGASLCQHRVR